MKKLLIRFSFILAAFTTGLIAGSLSAQTTVVSVTVTDNSGQIWANGSISYTFRGNGSSTRYQWQGADLPNQYLTPTLVPLDNTASASFTIPTSTTISPAGSTWTYTVCPNASVQCQNFILPTVGNTQNISSFIIPNAPSISVAPLPLGYSDSQVKTVPAQGGQYYNTYTAPGVRIWNGSAWVTGGGGGSGLSGPYNLSGQITTLLNGSVIAVGSPFSMGISCTAEGNFEIGYATTNPNVCTLSYSNGTPATAFVNDGAHNYTATTSLITYSGAYSYTTNTIFYSGSTATNSQSASVNSGVSFYPCTFAGVGTGGSGTSAAASGSGAGNQCASETATLVGASGTLPSYGLSSPSSFSLNPSGQYLYLLLPGGCGHTFTVNTFATTFTQHAFTYTNILGGSQSACLAVSPTSYTGTYSVVVIS